MKLMDFDGLFDEKLSQYMEENKGKYTEKQWENIIPRLYQKFGDTYVAKVKCTPKEYYARMTDEELTATLSSPSEGTDSRARFSLLRNRGKKLHRGIAVSAQER